MPQLLGITLHQKDIAMARARKYSFSVDHAGDSQTFRRAQYVFYPRLTRPIVMIFRDWGSGGKFRDIPICRSTGRNSDVRTVRFPKGEASAMR